MTIANLYNQVGTMVTVINSEICNWLGVKTRKL